MIFLHYIGFYPACQSDEMDVRVEYWQKRGEKMKREEKENPVNWEVKDPKPPVVQSGHLEGRKR